MMIPTGRTTTRILGVDCRAGHTPQLSITYRPIEHIQPSSKNPRLHSEKQVQQIARSIKAFGFNVPLLVNEHGQLIAGHGRWLGAQLLGLKEVPTICLGHLSAVQAQAFMIADNRLTENAEWNSKLLAEQLKMLSEADLDFSLDVTGFEIGEIDVLIEGLAPAIDGGQDPADAVPETSTISVSHKGDLWRLGHHRVYCGNALDRVSYSELMEGVRADMVFTDPPYNVRIIGHAGGLGAIQHKNFQMASR
jgi:ParB-like chromosome segregation protein Spo0J